jgi:hypothetical protein
VSSQKGKRILQYCKSLCCFDEEVSKQSEGFLDDKLHEVVFALPVVSESYFESPQGGVEDHRHYLDHRIEPFFQATDLQPQENIDDKQYAVEDFLPRRSQEIEGSGFVWPTLFLDST